MWITEYFLDKVFESSDFEKKLLVRDLLQTNTWFLEGSICQVREMSPHRDGSTSTEQPRGQLAKLVTSLDFNFSWGFRKNTFPTNALNIVVIVITDIKIIAKKRKYFQKPTKRVKWRWEVIVTVWSMTKVLSGPFKCKDN